MLGLPSEDYDHLLSSTTHILHNAWPVNFNRAVTSFKPSIEGLNNLISFTRECTHDARLLFVSSISVASNWAGVAGGRADVPEAPIEDWRLAKMGYGQAKLIAERLLNEAAKTCGIQTAICRVGQVAGPVMRGELGEWNKSNWVPSLIQSSKLLGCIPNELGPIEKIDWIPVDYVSQIIVEMLLLLTQYQRDQGVFHTHKRHGADIYHIVNPHRSTWSSLVPTVQRSLGGNIRAVTLKEWVEILQESMVSHGQDSTDFNRNPAAKLLPFYESVADKAEQFPDVLSATLSTKETYMRTKIMRELKPVDEEWMECWMRQWKF